MRDNRCGTPVSWDGGMETIGIRILLEEQSQKQEMEQENLSINKKEVTAQDLEGKLGWLQEVQIVMQESGRSRAASKTTR